MRQIAKLNGPKIMNRVKKSKLILRLFFLALILISGYQIYRSLDSSQSKFFHEPIKLGSGNEWRPYPLLIDFNRDGHLDIIATHRTPITHNALHIWTGNGKGLFSEVEQSWRTPFYSGLAAGDINHDERIDLVAASHFGNVYTYLSNDKNEFTVSLFNLHEDGYTVARLADLDEDGNLDLVLLGDSDGGVEIFRGDGTGQWSFVTRFLEGTAGRDLALGDLNNDGKLDMVASMEELGVITFWGSGIDKWVVDPTDFASPSNEFGSVVLGDINQDGYLDIALSGSYLGRDSLNGPDVFFGNGSGGWHQASDGLKKLKYAVEGIALLDVNQDQHLDLVVGGKVRSGVDPKAYGLFLFTGDGQGNWTLRPDSGLPEQGLPQSYGIATGDLNGDKFTDIAVVHGFHRGKEKAFISIWLHKGKSEQYRAD